MVVRGEQRASASLFLEVFDHGPGDGEAVESGGTAADFVEQNEAGRCRMAEDGGDFGHFYEEGGAAAGQVVAGADAREDAVGDGKFGLPRGNEAAHLGHKNDERRLAQVSGLAAHVGAGDEKKLLAARFEAEIVGNEALAFLAEKLFNDRMAGGGEKEFAAVAKFGADVTAVGG